MTEKRMPKIVWFNLKKLISQIVNEELTEKMGFIYLMIIVLAYSLAGYFKMLTSSFEAFGYESLWFTVIEMVIVIPLFIICLSNAFAINRRIDNKEFLKRLVALSFVINIRLIVLIIPLYVILSILQEIIGKQPELFEIIHLIVSILWSVLYFIILVKSFQRVYKLKKEN